MIKPKHILLITLFVLLSLGLSGCRGSGSVATGWPGIALDGDTAYVAYNQSIYVIDLTDDGRQLDTLPAETLRGGETFFHTPALLGDDKLVEGSYKQTLYLFDTDDGSVSEFFAGSRNRWIGDPVVVDEVLYAPNANGSLYALDFDGEELWSFPTEGPLWASPLVDGERVYIASQDHKLYAVNSSTGNSIWETDLGGVLLSAPIIDENGTLYIGSLNGYLYAIDSDTGSILWDFEADDWIWGSPALGPEGVLYATDLSATIYAISLEDGHTLLWDKQVDTNSRITGSVLFYNDTIYAVTESGMIAAYGTDGERLWKESIGEGQLYGTPILAGDDLILASALGAEYLIYAYNADLEPVWQYTPQNGN